MHRLSPRREGQVFQLDLLDYEDRSSTPPVARTALEHWCIRAHLTKVQDSLTFKTLWDGPLPPSDPGRLDALVRWVGRVLRNPESKRHGASNAAPLHRFLIREAATIQKPQRDRICFRDALVLLHEDLINGLTKEQPLRLTRAQVERYEKNLAHVRFTWKLIKDRNPNTRLQRRREFILSQAGLDNEDELIQKASGRMLEICPPREVAAFLLCVQEELLVYHPQTVLQAISEARKIAALDPETPKRPRRGRPTRTQNI